ncbi:MAG: FkbM family methyltransferase [Chitinispirillaceae bacterium]|nr:FkbM family methyltransferase [Chitinispirillaceae bacterium]
MQRIKVQILYFLRFLMRALPRSLQIQLSRVLPKGFLLLPENVEFVFDGYLSDFRVEVNTLYPIEREMLSGSYDPDSQSIIRRFLHSGDTGIDIGANIGALSLTMVKAVYPSGLVYSFEPGKILYNRLLKNIALNPSIQKNILPVNKGLSNKEGELFWHESPLRENRGNACLNTEQGTDGISVPVTTLDLYFADKDTSGLKFIKIDVEGMEREVLQGGMELLKAVKPIIYYESYLVVETNRGEPVLRDIESILSQLGYRFYKTDGMAQLTETHYPDLTANTLAIHRDSPFLPR